MGVVIVEGKVAVLGVNLGRPIVTNWDFVAQSLSAVRSGDAPLPELLWDFLLSKVKDFSRSQAAMYNGKVVIYWKRC